MIAQHTILYSAQEVELAVERLKISWQYNVCFQLPICG